MSYGYVYIGVVCLYHYIRRGLRVASSRFVGDARALEAELQLGVPLFLCLFSNKIILIYKFYEDEKVFSELYGSNATNEYYYSM